MKHPCVEFILACACCTSFSDFIKEIAPKFPNVETRVYVAGKDTEYLAKYGKIVRRVPMGIPESLLTFLLALAPAAILRSGVTLLYTLFSHPSGFSLGVFLLSSALPEVGGTLLLALPVFFLFRGRA